MISHATERAVLISVRLSSLPKSPMYHTVSHTVSALSNSCERVSAPGKEQKKKKEKKKKKKEEEERIVLFCFYLLCVA